MPERKRSGYGVGLLLAVTSPFSIAFWLAVMADQGGPLSLARSLALALAVVAGATSWALALCLALRLGARWTRPSWQIVTRSASGLVMLAYALRLLSRLLWA